MARHILPDGRQVHLARLMMEGTYSGHLEGSPETLSPRILQRAPAQAASLLAPAKPLVVIPPPTMPLPRWFCVAKLWSHEGARTKDPDFRSFLYACWYMGETDRSIDAMIDSILPAIDWDDVAEDYDFTLI